MSETTLLEVEVEGNRYKVISKRRYVVYILDKAIGWMPLQDTPKACALAAHLAKLLVLAEADACREGGR